MTHLVLFSAAVVASQPLFAQSSETANTRVQREEERAGDRQGSADRPQRRSPWRLYGSTGAFYSTGTFGTETRTNSLVVPFTLRATRGPLRLSASMPFIRIRGSREVIVGDDDGPIVGEPDTTTERDTRSGFGDLNLRARYRIAPKSWKGVELDLLGRVKLPTGSERKGLSTGEVDYAVGGELSYTRGRVEPFAEVQYRINGDRPGTNYRNSIRTSVGASTRVARGVNGSLSYDYSQSRIRGRGAAHSLDGSLSTRLSRRLTLSGFGSVGLSKRADDFSVGSTVTARIF
jgi:hypothetical protein